MFIFIMTLGGCRQQNFLHHLLVKQHQNSCLRLICEKHKGVIHILHLPWSLKLCWASYFRYSEQKSLWCASTKLCFRTVEFLLAPVVRIVARFTLPVLPLQWSPNAVTFLWVPFYFVSFLPFSGQKTVCFSLHCLGTNFFSQIVLIYKWLCM